MIRRWVIAGLLIAAVTGCARVAESNFNPFNWFGGDRENEALTPNVVVVTDDRPLIDEVVSIRVERTPGGAILHAVGRARFQGYWLADLSPLPERSSAGTLAYQFRVLPPETTTRISSPASRQLTAAVFLSDQTLANARVLEVYGATNARSVRR